MTPVAWGFIYILAALIGIILSTYAVKSREILGFRYFAAFAFFQSAWSLFYGLELLLPGFPLKVAVAKIEYLPIVAAPVLWLIFSLSYTKYANWINLRRALYLSMIPTITVALVFTNELHGLIWSELVLVDTGKGIEMIDYSHGFWFWIQISYSYMLFTISLGVLLKQLFITSKHYKKQIMFILFSALFPFFFSAVYLFDSEFIYDLTPLGFCASIVLIMWGMFFSNIFGLKSTAREAVLELMQDAVIVTDEQQNILDLNQRAMTMLANLKSDNALPLNNVYGQHIDSVFPISNRLIPFESELPQHEQQAIGSRAISSRADVGEFTKIHVQLQARLEENLKSKLSKTDAGVKVLKHMPTAVNNDPAYSLDVTQGEKFYKIRVSNFSSVTKQRGRVLVIQDITVQKEQDRRLEEMIFFDKLTGLYNRYSFMQYGKLLLQQNVPVSLLLIDLDRFKHVNDSLGHSVGDDLLIQVSKRIDNVVSESDTLARLGTDEFAILSTEQSSRRVKATAEDILFAFRSPYSLQGEVVHISASIGIVLEDRLANGQANNAPNIARKTEFDIEDLLRYSDIAMYEAKHQGLGYSIYSPKETVTSLKKLNLETELKQAIEQSEFKMFYQPIVTAFNGGLVGFEALIRWEKDGNYIGPAQFLSFAEEIGMMKQIDYWVLERVIKHDKAHLPPGFVALNLSGVTLRDKGLVDLAKQLISDGYSVDGIVLEVTESAMMNVGIATSILNELKALGFQIAIDDFGTGYSSLSYIEQFPLDILKIDKSFVNGIGKSEVSEALLRTIINLGQNLGVIVLAEGIETSDQHEWLLEEDCLYLQGHLFGWPQSVAYYESGEVNTSVPDVEQVEVRSLTEEDQIEGLNSSL